MTIDSGGDFQFLLNEEEENHIQARATMSTSKRGMSARDTYSRVYLIGVRE